jgi:hypothetical protein
VIQKLGGEVAGAEISGDHPEDVRKKIMQDVNAAQRSVREATETSERQLERVYKQAANLAEQGQVSHAEGERLKTLSEAARQCLEQVKTP